MTEEAATEEQELAGAFEEVARFLLGAVHVLGKGIKITFIIF